KPKDWTRKLPKKVKRLALISALSSAVEKKKLTVLDKIEIESPKSKLVSEIVKNLDLKGSTLIVLNEKNDNLLLGSRNILGLNPTLLNNLNAYDILNARNVVFMKDAILGVQKKYENK
ncbi:50S ribosomal protein L4, partial [candidate division WWE3 bacterium RIFCSPLOWO2_01_FULL_41_9]